MSVRKRRKLPVWHFCLRDVLERKGMSQGQLARITGMPREQITTMCNRPCNPTWRIVLQIVTHTGWSLDEFLPKGDGAPPANGRKGKGVAA